MSSGVYNSRILQMLILSPRFFRLVRLLLVFLACSAAFSLAADFKTPEEQLAHKIAGVTGPGAVFIDFSNRASLPKSVFDTIRRELLTELASLGLHFVPAEQAAAIVRFSLSEDLQNYVWIAEISQGTSAPVVTMVASLRSDTATVAHSLAPLTIRKTLLWQQDVRMLDATVIDGSPSHLIVLDTEKIVAYRYQDNRWQAEQSLPIVHPHSWPRDARGRLVLRRDHLLDAYLPGTLCQSSGGKPLTLTCRSSDDPWPLGSEQSGLNGFFASSRNYFTGALSPGIGKQTTTAPFYSAAVLPRDKYTLAFLPESMAKSICWMASPTAVPENWDGAATWLRFALHAIRDRKCLPAATGLGLPTQSRRTNFQIANRSPPARLWSLEVPSVNCGQSRMVPAPSRFYEILKRGSMKHIALLSLVISSVVFSSVSFAAARPHYGGTLRIATRSSPSSLDPLQQTNSLTENNLTRLIFDTLTTTSDRGTVQPWLATSWAAEPGNQRWQIRLRTDVTFADGSPLSTDVVASSLRASNPKWKIFPNSDSIIIETDIPNPQLPSELALGRNAIVKRSGALLGTGPFTLAQWQPGKSLVLTAKENYWGGRPFIDAIQVSLGQNQRDQIISLNLGNADVVEIPPEQSRHAGMESDRVSTTQPVELLTLVFARDGQSSDEEALRQALALSIDRSSINNVLLQGAGVPAGSLLPDWMSGYSFLFPSELNLVQARQLRSQSRQSPTWTLGYDINDPLARVIADRIALNSRDAGITIQVSSNHSTDVRLTRIRIDSLDPRLALLREAQSLGLPEPAISGNSPEDLFSAESSLLRSGRVIPLLHVRDAYGLANFIKSWNAGPGGSWRLEDVWLGAGKN